MISFINIKNCSVKRQSSFLLPANLRIIFNRAFVLRIQVRQPRVGQIKTHRRAHVSPVYFDARAATRPAHCQTNQR